MTLPSPDRDVKDDVIEKMCEAHWMRWSQRTTHTAADRIAMRAAVRALAAHFSNEVEQRFSGALNDGSAENERKYQEANTIRAALRAIAGPET